MLLFIGIAFVALLILGLPIGMILLALSVLYVLFEPAIMDLAFAQRVITGTQSFPLLAVPLFILTGELMNISGITRRVMDFAALVPVNASYPEWADGVDSFIHDKIGRAHV